MEKNLRGLYGIADTTFLPQVPVLSKTEQFLAGGATVIQLRLKGMGSREALEVLRAARARVEGRALLIVNDRIDLALAADADGVHLGAEDLPIAAARGLMGSKIVGATVRTLEEARQAVRDGADYVGFGPIFDTSTKTLSVAPRGLSQLAEVAAGLPIPVVAIGGITLERVGAVIEAGASAVAVIAAVSGAADPVGTARAFSLAVERAHTEKERSER